jgi:hypothetical protein
MRASGRWRASSQPTARFFGADAEQLAGSKAATPPIGLGEGEVGQAAGAVGALENRVAVVETVAEASTLSGCSSWPWISILTRSLAHRILPALRWWVGGG